MFIFSLIPLIILSCTNIPAVIPSEQICVGKKNDEYFCYYGLEVNDEDCLDYGYGQNKGSVDFSYFQDINCPEFCNEIYDSGLECNIILLDE